MLLPTTHSVVGYCKHIPLVDPLKAQLSPRQLTPVKDDEGDSVAVLPDRKTIDKRERAHAACLSAKSLNVTSQSLVERKRHPAVTQSLDDAGVSARRLPLTSAA